MLPKDFAGLIILAVIAVLALRWLSGRAVSRRRHRDGRGTGGRGGDGYPPPLSDPAPRPPSRATRQLDAVMASEYRRKPIMGKGEYRTFRVVEEAIGRADAGFRVFAQTSLGEVLASDDADGFFAINAKRVDILVIDGSGLPVLAVEYNGAGHYRGNAAERDAIKGEALRRAGVRLLAVTPEDDAAWIATSVRRALGLPEDAAPRVASTGSEASAGDAPTDADQSPAGGPVDDREEPKSAFGT